MRDINSHRKKKHSDKDWKRERRIREWGLLIIIKHHLMFSLLNNFFFNLDFQVLDMHI